MLEYNQWCNQDGTIQRHQYHWAQDTERRQTIPKNNNTTKKTKKMSNPDHTKNTWTEPWWSLRVIGS
jgi:hypothetical protein